MIMGDNIGYHTRLYGDNTTKVVGGSFGGAIDMQTVERLVRAHFTVTVKPSGATVFVDKQGREVRLYFSIDPGTTTAGQAALREDRAKRMRQAELDRDIEERQQQERDDAMIAGIELVQRQATKEA